MLRPTLLLLAALALPVAFAPDAPRTTVHGETIDDIPDLDLRASTARAAVAQDGGVPATWCGDPLTADDTANAAFPASAGRIKVVYAHAADRPNRFAGWQDALQANVAVINRYLALQAGGTKALRFDMGTRCGPRYVDLQLVTLPGPATQFVDDFRAVAGAVNAALGEASGPRNAIVLADGLSGIGVEHGLAETITGPTGEQPGAANPHNRGGLTGIVFSRDGGEPPGAGAGGFWPEGFLHEITHTLGAVQWGAPHSTQPPGQQNPGFGHCWQGTDVMCYVENAGSSAPLRIDCAPFEGAIAITFDCGRDDYFNPAPAPGSYLATHWNTYDSVFMAECTAIAPACAGQDVTVPSPTAHPGIRGAVRKGATLRASKGSWSNRPTRFKYRWQRLSGTKWRSISRADRLRYRPTAHDVGRRLRVVVAATNQDGTTATASQPTPRVGG